MMYRIRILVMKTKFVLIAALLASFSSIAFSATIQELEERIAHIEAVLAQIDADEDSYTPEQGDCDDSDAETHPDANESDAGNDGRDNDCKAVKIDTEKMEWKGKLLDSDDDSDHDGSDSDDDSGHDSSGSDDDSDHDGDDDRDDDDDDDCDYWWQCW